MSNKLEVIQKIILYGILIIAIFIIGVLVGKKMERQSQIEEPFVETQAEPETEIQTEEPPQTETVSAAEPETQAVSENKTASGNETPSGNETVSGNGTGEKPEWKEEYHDPVEKMPLAKRLTIRSSYEETLLVNRVDKELIDKNNLDFSGMTIACLGDSITEGAPGHTPYPTFLKEILGAKEVYNLGKGGSTVASGDGVATMIDRCYEIPLDVDIIIVIGGTNDNFQQPSWKFGFMDWETKGEGTFCGDLQLLMRKFKWSYPNAKVLFLTPPSNSKIDELKLKDPSLLDQSKYAEAINYIGAEEQTAVTDLFNANFLNSHDPEIMKNFMVDKVHMNTEGNRLLAERIAGELFRRYQ